MSPLPYLPGGVTELPAARFVLFADGNHLVQRIDESALLLNGVSYTGFWESGSLHQGNREATIDEVGLEYVSLVATTATVLVSGNGGETWNESLSMNVQASAAGRLRRDRLYFRTTGYDLRVRIELDSDQIFYLYRLLPVITLRSEYVVNG